MAPERTGMKDEPEGSLARGIKDAAVKVEYSRLGSAGGGLLQIVHRQGAAVQVDCEAARGTAAGSEE